MTFFYKECIINAVNQCSKNALSQISYLHAVETNDQSISDVSSFEKLNVKHLY